MLHVLREITLITSVDNGLLKKIYLLLKILPSDIAISFSELITDSLFNTAPKIIHKFPVHLYSSLAHATF